MRRKLSWISRLTVFEFQPLARNSAKVAGLVLVVMDAFAWDDRLMRREILGIIAREGALPTEKPPASVARYRAYCTLESRRTSSWAAAQSPALACRMIDWKAS